MVMMFVFDAVVVAVGAGFGFSLHWAGLAVLAALLALLMIIMAAFSIATALVTKEISGFAAIANGINLPVLLLAGVLLPISLGPPWMRVLAHFNPLYYLVEASRVLAAGTLTGPAVWQAFAVLLPLCVLVLSWATRIFRRAVAWRLSARPGWPHGSQACRQPASRLSRSSIVSRRSSTRAVPSRTATTPGRGTWL